MSDHEPNGDPTPGWPGAPDPGAAHTPPGWVPAPDPTYPGAPTPAPAPPPGASGPPPGYPPSAPPPGYGYGYAGYPGYPVTRDHPQGTTILVLGILSLVVCGLLGPVAWIMGNKAIKEIDANPAAYGNRGNVQAGRIIGIVATCLMGLTVAIYGTLVIVLVAGRASS